jgi:hypothetical protein
VHFIRNRKPSEKEVRPKPTPGCSAEEEEEEKIYISLVSILPLIKLFRYKPEGRGFDSR